MSKAPDSARPAVRAVGPTTNVPPVPHPMPAASKTACSPQIGAGELPHGYCRCTAGPLAASSHSAELGSRPPRKAHTFAACARVRPFCGCRCRTFADRFTSHPLATKSFAEGGVHPPINASQASCRRVVTSNLPMRKPCSIVTSTTGRSSSPAGSASGAPIGNVPGGMWIQTSSACQASVISARVYSQ